MDSNEFWCRAFLAAMHGEYSADVRWDNHGAPASYCERAADAALAVAQRRGMVTGERAAAPEDQPAGCTCRLVMGLGDPSGPRRALVPSREPCPVHAPDRGHVLERVEFTAELDGDIWELRTKMYQSGLIVSNGDDRLAMIDGNTIRIKWGETSPPKPIEVWIERSAKGDPR